MLRIWTILFITVFVIKGRVVAQNKRNAIDSTAVSLLTDKAEKLRYNNAADATNFARQAFDIAIQSNDIRLQEKCLLTMLACISDNGKTEEFKLFEKRFDSLDAITHITPFFFRKQKITILYHLTQARYHDCLLLIDSVLLMARQNLLSDTGELYYAMGVAEIGQFNFAGAKISLNTALETVKKGNEMLSANTKLQLAFVLSIFKDSKNAGVYYNDALTFYKTNNILTGIAQAYTLMGVNALMEYNFNLAAEYDLKSAEYYRLANKELGVALSLCQGGIALYSARKNDSAFLFLKESFSIFKRLNYAPGISVSSSFLSILYRQTDSTLLAQSYLNLAQIVNKQLQVPVFTSIANLEEAKNGTAGTTEIQNIISISFDTLKNITPGFLSKDLKNQVKYRYTMDSSSVMAKLYADSQIQRQEKVELENSKMLIEAGTKFQTGILKDSLNNQAVIIKQTGKQIKNNYLLIGMLTCAFVSIALLCLLLYRRLSDRKEETEAMKLFAAQLRHENNNGIALIINLLSKSLKEQGFSNLDAELKFRLKAIADMQSSDYITPDEKGVVFSKYIKDLVEEIDVAFNNNKKISYELNMPDKMKAKHALKLAVLIRELTLNSLKHAFGSVDNGSIYIELTLLKKGIIKFEFKDNGCGLNPQSQPSISFGTSIITAISSQLGGKPVTDTKDGYNFTLLFHK